MNTPTLDVLAERIEALQHRLLAHEGALQAALNGLRTEVIEYRSELREARKWLLGNGHRGVLEEVRDLRDSVGNLAEAVRTRDEQKVRVKIAVITSTVALVGVLFTVGAQVLAILRGG